MFSAQPKQIKSVGTGRNWFDPVLVHMTENSIAWLAASLLLWTSTREVV